MATTNFDRLIDGYVQCRISEFQTEKMEFAFFGEFGGQFPATSSAEPSPESTTPAPLGEQGTRSQQQQQNRQQSAT